MPSITLYFVNILGVSTGEFQFRGFYTFTIRFQAWMGRSISSSTSLRTTKFASAQRILLEKLWAKRCKAYSSTQPLIVDKTQLKYEDPPL